MGCHNAACSLSGLDIKWNDVVYVVPCWVDDNKTYPICGPFLGKYDDYGCVDDPYGEFHDLLLNQFSLKTWEEYKELYRNRKRGLENAVNCLIKKEIYDSLSIKFLDDENFNRVLKSLNKDLDRTKTEKCSMYEQGERTIYFERFVIPEFLSTIHNKIYNSDYLRGEFFKLLSIISLVEMGTNIKFQKRMSITQDGERDLGFKIRKELLDIESKMLQRYSEKNDYEK